MNFKYNEMNPCNQSYESDIFFFSSKSKCVEKFLKNEDNNELCVNQYCPLECDSFKYDIILQTVMEAGSGKINTKKSSTNYVGFNTYENLSRTFHALRVYYEGLEYTLIKQQPRTELFSLISNLGGILGLFLGFSFISVLEIFEVVAELLFDRFS